MLATFAGGCFWCTEAIFKRLKGVTFVLPGYIGGEIKNPTYEQVCSGKTGHAEAIEVEYDPKIISYQQLLEVFFATHNPTTLNQQGNDVGSQYRSSIFYHDQDQKEDAAGIIEKLQSKYDQKIVTKLEKATTFYPAESYHQEYYEYNKNAPYCQVIIDPKIQKLYKEFQNIVKSSE